MNIFEKIDFLSNQKMAAIFNSIWQTNDHEPENGTNFFMIPRPRTNKI